MRLKKYKSQGNAVEVTVNSKEENSFVCISSKNPALESCSQTLLAGQWLVPYHSGLYMLYHLFMTAYALHIDKNIKAFDKAHFLAWPGW